MRARIAGGSLMFLGRGRILFTDGCEEQPRGMEGRIGHCPPCSDQREENTKSCHLGGGADSMELGTS